MSQNILIQCSLKFSAKVKITTLSYKAKERNKISQAYCKYDKLII